MRLAIHSKFMEAWSSLTSYERKQVDDMMRRIARDGITPGMRPHQIPNAKMDLVSLSANMDLRVLAWRQDSDLILLYVNHHDESYAWADRNSIKIEIAELLTFSPNEPVTGSDDKSATLVTETKNSFQTGLQVRLTENGVPPAIQRMLMTAESEEEVIDILELVSPEWQGLLLDTITESKPTLNRNLPSNIWISPDDDALRLALALPLAQWRVFLHPKQQEVVNIDTSNDVVVTGGPGTGKTVALVHRAVRLSMLCTENECVVLVGHSPNAVRLLQKMTNELAGKPLSSLHIVDMIAIGRDGRPQVDDVRPPINQKGYLQHLGKAVIALIIDEAQDVHRNHTKSWIFGGRPQIQTHLTIAVDFNQNIFADNSVTNLLAAIRRARVVSLNYSYRIPREAGLLAEKLIAQVTKRDEDTMIAQLREISRSMSYGFTSEFVKVKVYNAIEQGISEAARERTQLLSSGAHRVGVIFCGNSTHRNVYATPLADLGFDILHNTGTFTPRSVKGDEFDYCVVVAPELMLDAISRKDFALQSIYVALSRCRKGVSIYTNDVFSRLLEHPAVEVTRL